MFNLIKKLFHREQETSKKERLFSSLVLFAYIFGLGYAGSSRSPGSFYQALIKPELAPPNWVFSVVWTVLFVLIGLSGYYVWNHYKDEFYRKVFIGLYIVNGLLVYSWSYVFFTSQSIANALYVMVGLIIVVELMILTAFKVNRKSAYLIMPYLAWILFATYLNVSMVALN